MPGKSLDCVVLVGGHRLRKRTAHDRLGDLLLAVGENEELKPVVKLVSTQPRKVGSSRS